MNFNNALAVNLVNTLYDNSYLLTMLSLSPALSLAVKRCDLSLDTLDY